MNQKTANKKYNPNSAITHLQRMGKSIQGAACIDNVSLTYSGNKLNTAQDTGISASMMGDAFHFVDGDDYYSEYGYDGCGSLTSDSNKGIHMIVYDFNGMPTCVWFDNGSITDYVYTADGVKLKTIHRTAVPGTVPSGSTPSLSEQNTLYKDSTLYIGALEVNSNIKEKYHFAGGFMEIMVGSLDTYNYYNTDHLGNVRHVSRSPLAGSTSIIQVNNYYPFGGLLKEGEHHWDIQNRFYNGKEYDRMQGLNLYDYSARQYDPAVCQFTSIDPLCEKSYNVSPYVYCHSNPVKRIDPDGKDDWEINKLGKIVNRIKNEQCDAFHIVDEVGKRLNLQTISFPYGSIEQATRQQTLQGKNYDVYQIRGDKNATQLFEFLSQNTNVEWSQMQTGLAGGKGLNFISTSHEHASEAGMSDLLGKQLRYGYTLRNNSHSHPNNTPYPSGLRGNTGDVPYADWVIKTTGQNPTFKIYLPASHRYITFSAQSGPEDFDIQFRGKALPEIIVPLNKMKR